MPVIKPTTHASGKKPKDKGIRRICHGILCRGEKEFTAYAGHRYCTQCRTAASNYADEYYKFTYF